MSRKTARYIREKRTLLGMTQAELAQKLGVQPIQVSRWERGVAEPHPLTLSELESLKPT